MKALICFATITTLAVGQETAPLRGDQLKMRLMESELAQKAWMDSGRFAFESGKWEVAAARVAAEAGKFAALGKFQMDKLGQMDLLGKPHLLDFGFPFAMQSTKGRAEDQAERQYDRGKRSLDKRQWEEALTQFNEAAAASKTLADGALYWKAYALMKLGRGKEATDVLDTLGRNHPQSRWLNDAKAMRLEIAQTAGRPVSPENAGDDELKLMAINGLMQGDPDRAIPLLDKILTSQTSLHLRERALFVLGQSNSAKARDVVARIAKGGANPDLQLQAIRTLGVHGGKENRQVLADVYAASSDLAVKRQILNGYMTSGERDRLLAVAKSDPVPELRLSAIRYLGNSGASSQLASLYGTESAPEIRKQILQSLFVAGNSQKLIEIAKTEKDAGLRQHAIRHLGTMNAASTGAALSEIYGANSDTETRKLVLQSLFVQGNGKQMVEVARKETNPELRRVAVQHLSNMHSKEATDFLMEILNK